MVGKIILTLLVIVVCFFTLQYMEQRVAPTHASDLAIEQIKENGSREQMRIEQHAQNHRPWKHTRNPPGTSAG